MQCWFGMVHGHSTTVTDSQELDYNQHQTLGEISLYLHSLFTLGLIQFPYKPKTLSVPVGCCRTQTEIDTVLFLFYTFYKVKVCAD